MIVFGIFMMVMMMAWQGGGAVVWCVACGFCSIRNRDVYTAWHALLKVKPKLCAFTKHALCICSLYGVCLHWHFSRLGFDVCVTSSSWLILEQKKREGSLRCWILHFDHFESGSGARKTSVWFLTFWVLSIHSFPLILVDLEKGGVLHCLYRGSFKGYSSNSKILTLLY